MPKCPKDCNKPNPLIFRRVIIPAALGDDKENPPQNGAYCNALVIYEANNAMYLYSSDGIPTKIPTALTSYNDLTDKPMINGVELIGDVTLEELGIENLVDDAISAEAAAREESDIELQDAIDAEEDARIAADEAIISQIPTVNDATLTLQRNNTNIGTFTANSSADTTINIDVPIYTSGLINDSGYITESALAGYATDQEVEDAVAAEAALRGDADQNLQEQIDAISSSSDVVDVVGTYAELQNYDTSKLGDNDIIKVLTDETHDDAISYYRWNDTTETFTYIGSQGPFYTKSETDATFVPQTRTVNGKALSSDIVLTASDVNALPASTVIPTVNNATLTIKKNGNNVATFTANSGTDVSADIIVPTKTSDITNDSGFITSAALPTKTSDLTNDGASGTSTYVESDDLATVATSGSYNDLSNKPDIMTGLTEMSYGESNAWAKFIAAYRAKQIVYCRASFNTNPATGPQGRKAFMACVDNAETPTYVEFQYVRSVVTKTAAQPVDQVFVYTLKSANGGTWTVQTRDMAPKLAQGTNTTVSYSNGTYTISATQPTVPTKTSDLTNDGSDGTSTYVEADDLATVATSGSYNDLSNKPTIPTVNNAVLTIQRNGANVDTFTANAAQDKTINIAVPTATSDLTNDSGFLTAIPTASSSVLGGVKVGSGLAITNGVLSVTGGGVADAVEWTNVLNRPTNVSYWTNDAGYITSAALPTKTSDLTNDGSDGNSTYVEADELSAVATSGSYNDLTNKPTIPVVNDATLTIQRNGVNIDSFTANASQNKSINVVVPTKTSDLTNDSNFVASTSLATVATSGSYNDLTNKPTIPTVNNATLTIKRNGTSEGTFTANASADNNVDIKVDILAITEDKVTVTTDTTKGVAPYSTSYGYTNIVADYPTPTEGSVVAFVINTKMVVASATRNVRVKFNDSDTWHPVMNASTTILAGNTYFTKAITRLFVYKSTQQSIGALHMINDDNTTYGYLVNTIATGFHTVETGGYMARYAISFYTQPMKTGNKVSSFVASSGTGTGKAYTSVAKYYADRGPVINYSANVAAAAATANVVYTYYQGMDLRYTANLSTTYIATNDHVFAYLKNFNTDDYSFEPSKNTKQIVSATKLATAFPSTTAGDIYLYLLGTNTSTYYTLNTPEKETNFIYKYTPSTGALTPLSGTNGGTSSVAWGDITGKPSFSTVATSGSYNDLSNKPTIPTVNNATLTIQRNSTSVGTFTANASSNKTIDIAVPTATSDLTNDSGFITSITKITNAEIDAIMGVA